MNITIEYPGTNNCRIWYMTTAGGDGIALRFHTMWSQVCAAHVAELEVGSHPFSRSLGSLRAMMGASPIGSRPKISTRYRPQMGSSRVRSSRSGWTSVMTLCGPPPNTTSARRRLCRSSNFGSRCLGPG